MTAVQSDIQKLEALLKSATNERQRKMYLSLLNKARASMASNSTPEEQKTAESSTEKTKTTASTKKKARNKTSKKQKSASQPTSKKTSLNNNSLVVTEDVSTNKNLTTEIDNEPQAAIEKEAERSTSEPETNPLNVEDKESTSTKKKTPKKSKRKKNSNKATSSPAFDSTNQPYFSGVGVIKCTPYIEDEKIFVEIDEQKYELHRVVGARHKQIELLKSELEQNGSREMLLRVYPNINHHSNGNPPHQIFRLVQFYLDQEKYPSFQEGFIFHGIWRVISYCSSPVITINRNINRLGVYKNLSSVAQKYFAKSQDFPVVWDAPIEPFKYNPELKKSEQMPCYFVRVRATFKDGQYIVTEMLSEPTLKIPRFIKPPRKNVKNQNKSKQSNQSNQKSDSTTEVVLDQTNQSDKESDATTEVV